MDKFNKYKEVAQKVADISAAQALMNWDQETYMPHGAAARRAKQQATLAAFRHDIVIKELYPLVQDLLQNIEQLDSIQQLNIKQEAIDLEKTIKLPTDFVALQTQKTAEAQFEWEQARKANDFKLFEAALATIVELKKQEADYYGYDESPYDALLDSYEPGMRSSEVAALFSSLKPRLVEFLQQVQNTQSIDDSFLHDFCPKDAQWQLTLKILKQIGFSFDYGRQDLSTHPFTTSFGMEDVRLTTRINEYDFCDALYSAIHEGGHGLYEQGLNSEYYGLPAGSACSLSIHESQSRMWENNVGRSLAFVEYIFEDLQKLLPHALKDKTPFEVFKALNKISPSFIRTSADELTYHLHIILRFEIEKGLIEGKILVKNLEELWNHRIQTDLGLSVPNANTGVLQDIHWSLGLFGYFPTYSLGSLYAAQFFEYWKKEQNDSDALIKKGQFDSLNRWNAHYIYRHGKCYSSRELCYQIAGEPLNANYFLDYIRKKINLIYNLNLS